jgi:predicted RNase H-like nuclease (RuvC/YqgF family)
MTPPEDKVRVASRISKDLDIRVRQFYTTSSSAIPEALELLASTKEDHDVKDDAKKEDYDVKNEESDVTNIGIDVNMTSAQIEAMQGRIEEYKVQVNTLNSEISRLQNVIMESPDPTELAVTKKDNEGLRLVIEEKDRSIERLEKEVNRLDLFSHYFKSVEVKQIEAPATEKKKPWYKFW